MDIAELEQAWAGMARQLEAQTRILASERRTRRLDALVWRLRLAGILPALQIVVGLIVALLAGSYWPDQLDRPHLLASGLALHAYGVGLIVAAATQLAALARIGVAQPVLALQAGVLRLRRLRIAGERALVVSGMLIWAPLLFIALAAIGIDPWPSRPAVIWLNLGIGVLLAGLTLWLSLRFREAFDRDASGRSLRAIEAEIAELRGSDD